MPYLCPTCREPLPCAAGHPLEVRDGVLRLVTPDFAVALDRQEKMLATYRGEIGRRLTDPAIYPTLPHGLPATGDREWRHRRYDLDLIVRALGRHPAAIATVLDVGAWNGWLSARLAARGHDVTGVDPFTDPYDGLGAHRHYRVRWTPVQLDVRDLTPLNTRYDLVVLNRCLAFAPDPVGMLRQAQARVAPGGLLVATGLQVFADPSAKAQAIADRSNRFETRHGLPFFLWPTRGYLDASDVSGFRAAGLRLRAYRWLRLHDLKARMRPTLPLHYHGHWLRP